MAWFAGLAAAIAACSHK